MLRFLGGAGSALLLVLAGFLIWQSRASQETAIPPVPPGQADGGNGPALPQAVRAGRGGRALPPSAPERTKEERRFGRADRDNDGRITREEMLQPRRRAYARLDRDGNGQLSFEEWANRTIERFAQADGNRDGALNAAEYASTRPQSRNRRPARQNCACAQPAE